MHQVAALERTALAWERTAFSIAALGAILLKVVDGGVLTVLTGLALLAAAAVVVLVVVPFGYRRARARVDPEAPGGAFLAEDRWRSVGLAATALLVSLTGVAVVVDLWLLPAA